MNMFAMAYISLEVFLMYKEEQQQINIYINKWVREGILKRGSRIVLFGAGDYSRGTLTILRSIDGYDFEYLIVDNDKEKRNSFCLGVKVINPSDLSDTEKTGIYIICSRFWREMKNQLLSIGISDSRICVIHLSTFEESLLENIRAIFRGRRIFKRITRKYPGKKILLCPYTGTGDIYLIGTYLFKYLEKEYINDFVLVVVNIACRKVAELFPIKNIEMILGNVECRYLIRYYMLCPSECRIKVLNDSWASIYTNPIQWFRGLHNMNFGEMFRIFVFNLDKDVKPVHPKFPKKNTEITIITEKYEMIKGRSVLIAPYANTLSSLPEMFWKKISDELKKKGYKVYTNVGNNLEKPIPGTEGVFITLSMAPQLVSWMGFFIGARSGFCDVISGSTAQKVILYDRNNRFYNVTAYEYFSLVKIGLDKEAIEIQYDGINQDDLFSDVIKEF